ncbi:MAG: hypothetical protein AB7S70_08215 [Hyphomicrobium sp.]|uniref:hypothetical protein n=1 Tax=Hyphomicrobium sp. TaxID=82 RepID=UPI003D14FFCD
MRAFVAKIPGLAAYLAFIGGLGWASCHLGLHLGAQVAMLAVPLLAGQSERGITLVERRQLEAPAVAETAPAVRKVPAVAPDAPVIPLGVLVARMDVSEEADRAPHARAPRREARARSRVRAKRPTRLAAADAFGRSFGVMLTASR